MTTKGRSVLITGCSFGIGNALTIEFHSRGLRVFAASRSIASMKELSDLGIETLQLDPTNAASIRSGRDEVSKRTSGRLNILVHNARQSLFDINIFAVMEMNNAFLPLLLPTKGVIVNHGSMVRSLAHPFTTAYNALKAVVSQYSNTLRIELEPFECELLRLVSGRVATDLITVPEISEGSFYKPLEARLQVRAREAETRQKKENFAEAVVKIILEKPRKVEVFKGNFATMAWAITIFAPRWILDAALRSTAGLDNARLRAEIAERAVAQSEQ